MRTNTQEAVLSAYPPRRASIGKRTPRDAAQDAAELSNRRGESPGLKPEFFGHGLSWG
jgi:hypothetical protein